MKTICFKRTLLLIIFIAWVAPLPAQEAIVVEEKESFRTYPFGDPSPVPRMDKIYPYFRFDGYSADSRDQEWKIVRMENPYITVFITPEIGGKIWGAVEKSTGKPFIYFNKVVKFRDIAMRGPWTSGGIEINFGAIGHAPTTSSPVDYLYRENNDGSASCFVGALDLASRTEWRVEIRLPKDRAYFETRAFWFNPTELNTSLYHWMNSSADAADDLRYYFPGNRYIDHGGKAYPWPIHENGRDVSLYGNNNFGSYKSYHVLGRYTDFFGGIFEKDRLGFGHWSAFGDKPGKKIWIWGLARQGMIWEDLLTDTDLGNRQYTEIQTGLLFNQAGANSTLTPFKHLFFVPNGVERFREVWFPVKDVGGMTDANEYGILNVEINGQTLYFEICPLQSLEEDVMIEIDGMEVYRKSVRLSPMKVFRDSIPADAEKEIEIILGNGLLSYSSGDDEKKNLARPMKMSDAFDWESVYGLYVQGAERAKQRDYRGALDIYLACLKKDSLYSPALVGLSELYYRRMEYDKALVYAKRALSNDAYDADANYIYGVINRKLGRMYDAKDGFGIAARSMKVRSAAYTQLAEIAIMERDYMTAEMYADRALDFNRYNLNARKASALCARKRDRKQEAREALDTILEIDPLNHFARFEQYFSEPKPERLDAFTTMIRNEFPHETYLELAAGYFNLGLLEETVAVLEQAPSHPIVEYWLAFLYDRQGNISKSQRYLAKALVASPSLVYPFRWETANVLEWAAKKKPHWKTWYYLALVYWSKDRDERAKQYFLECGDAPDYAPFYITRGKFLNPENPASALKDYKKALDSDPGAWRSYYVLVKDYMESSEYKKCLDIARQGAKKFPGNYMLRFEYARALLYNEYYEDCLAILKEMTILPHEGARYGHDVYRQACLLYGMEHMKKKDYDAAVEWIGKARLWPENLGVGRPYDVDNRIEDFLEGVCYSRMGNEDEARSSYDKIVKYTEEHPNLLNSNLYITALALKNLNKQEEAEKLLVKWKSTDPQSIAANWAHALFYGRQKQANDLLKNLKAETQGTPWNPVESDPDFTLILEIANVVQ